MAQWSIPLDVMARHTQDDIDKVARVSTFLLFRAVVRASPVATGRFRANWNVNVGAPDYSFGAETGAGRADVQLVTMLGAPLGGTIWLTNGLPYARRLEYGWSKQAPTGMVRNAVLRFQDFIRAAARGGRVK